MFEQLQQRARDLSIATGAFLATGLATGLAMAAAPADPFDAALATATENVGGYAAGLVTLSAVAVVFMIAMKYVKKIPRAS